MKYGGNVISVDADVGRCFVTNPSDAWCRDIPCIGLSEDAYNIGEMLAE
jgi:hypothetical protein